MLHGKKKLYDQRSDPMEWHNLAADHAHVALKAQLRDELEALLAPLD